MINNQKNEKGNIINSINNEIEQFPADLKDLIKYGKWQLTLISSLKMDKNYKKNLILIDREWLSQWKELTGYNYIKNKIFAYLSYTQQQKNNVNINEECKKLINFWINIKKKNKIDSNNLQKLKQLNNKQYLLNYNNRTIINGKSNFDIISSDIFDIFKKYFEKSVNIKVGGLFTKKKLLLPFNYNDNNIDYIYINMMFIKDNKNNIDEILFIFPKLKLNIIEKIRKDISSKEISQFINDFNNKDNEKEFYFNDIDGNKYTYKGIYKSNYTHNKLPLNSDNKINENSQNNITDKFIQTNKNINNEINEKNNMLNLNINNLSYEEIIKKIKETEEKINKIKELENTIKDKENIYLNEQKELKIEKIEFNKEKNNIYNNNNNNYNKIKQKSSKKLNNNNLEEDTHLKEENDKYIEHLKEMEFKNQHLYDEIEKCKEKENILNNEYKKVKNDYLEKEKELNQKIYELDNKEKNIKSKDNKLVSNLNKKEIELKNKGKELEIKEDELNEKEKELNVKEIELNDEEKKNKEKKKEIMKKKEEILNKLKIIKNKEDIENEQINNELDQEIQELEEKLNKNNKLNIKSQKYVTNIKIEEEKEEIEEKEEEEQNEINNDSDNNKVALKYKKIKSVNQANILDNGKNSVNVNINRDNTNKVRSPNFISSKTLTCSNINDISLNKNLSMTSSLGLIKQNKIVNLNAIIQCFVHLKEITEGILNLDNNNFFSQNDKNIFSRAYSILINNLFFPSKFNNINGVYSLSSFLDLIIEKLKENKQYLNHKIYYKSEDLLNIIIEGLHKELNTKKRICSSIDDKQFEGTNEKEALCKYLEMFTKNNNSIISKYLYGLLKKKIICQGCKKEKYNFKCYSFLYFNLLDIKKFINQNDRNIQLQDLFDYYNKPEYLVGEKGFFCNNCNSKKTTTILKSIYSSHIILPIIIDRGDDSNLIKDKIEFPDELDISNYIEYKSCSKHFYLCGVVSNLGLSNNNGKFEAFCKIEQYSSWFHYNNEQVSSCNAEDVHNKGMQYILFYHKANK